MTKERLRRRNKIKKTESREIIKENKQDKIRVWHEENRENDKTIKTKITYMMKYKGTHNKYNMGFL